MIRAVYPGSFDPVTVGHLDLIERASGLCTELIVAVIDNPNKKTLFSLSERKELLATCLGHLPNVSIDAFSGLLVDYLQSRQARLVFRGLRDSADTPTEMQMARLNRQMWPGCDTAFLSADGRFAHVSSSFVREIARLGGPIEHLVHPAVGSRLQSKLSSQGAQ
jgi:pantetheine-phosphate adenylyltransferase